MEVIVTIVSKLGYNLSRGLTTYLYWGYNLVTKYHGHPSTRIPPSPAVDCLDTSMDFRIASEDAD